MTNPVRTVIVMMIMMMIMIMIMIMIRTTTLSDYFMSSANVSYIIDETLS